MRILQPRGKRITGEIICAPSLSRNSRGLTERSIGLTISPDASLYPLDPLAWLTLSVSEARELLASLQRDIGWLEAHTPEWENPKGN